MRVLTKSNYNNMNKKLLTIITGTAFAGSLYGGISLSEDLTLNGYIDIAYEDTQGKGVDADGEEKVSEIELAFNFSPTESPISAVAELSFNAQDTGAEGPSNNPRFETVTVTYALNDSFSVSAGNLLTYMGWETYDATGLFQYSFAYKGGVGEYEGYAVGLSADYATDQFSLGFGLGDAEFGDLYYEFAGKYKAIDNVTFFAMVALAPDYTTFNTWASYAAGGLTIAGEYLNKEMDDKSNETDQYLAMINYAFESGFAATFRYSVQTDTDEPNASTTGDLEKVTFSPSYTFSDNLVGLFEISQYDYQGLHSDTDDYTQFAFEIIYIF